jgi:hypothetical protein
LTLASCLQVPSRSLTDPWKHAVNSVRTGLRLIMTQLNAECSTTNITPALEKAISTLNKWREPFASLTRTCELNGVDGGGPNMIDNVNSACSDQEDGQHQTYPQLDHFRSSLLNITLVIVNNTLSST